MTGRVCQNFSSTLWEQIIGCWSQGGTPADAAPGRAECPIFR